jgi:hypothetical protein
MEFYRRCYLAEGKVGDAWTARVHRLELLFDAALVLLRSKDRISSRGVGCCMQQLKGGVVCCMLSYCIEQSSINSEVPL